MKHITSKLLSLLLCLAMLMSMVPVAYADETGGAGEDSTSTETYVAKIGEKEYQTLDAAIMEAQTGDTINIVAEGTYTLPNLEGKSVTFSGSKNVKIDMKNQVNKANSLCFDGVTVEFGTTDYTFLHSQQSGL